MTKNGTTLGVTPDDPLNNPRGIGNQQPCFPRCGIRLDYDTQQRYNISSSKNNRFFKISSLIETYQHRRIQKLKAGEEPHPDLKIQILKSRGRMEAFRFTLWINLKVYQAKRVYLLRKLKN